MDNDIVVASVTEVDAQVMVGWQWHVNHLKTQSNALVKWLVRIC